MDFHNFLAILAIVSAISVRAQEVTTVTMLTEEKSVYVEENNTVMIECNLNPNGKPVRWVHRDREIAMISIERTVHYMDPQRDGEKYNITVSASGNNSTMTIYRFTSSDAGKVQCEVSAVDPLVTRLHLIKLPDRIYITKQAMNSMTPGAQVPPELRVGEADWLNLTCVSTNSKPKPALKWWWNNTRPVTSSWSSPRFSTATGAVTGSSTLHLPPGFPDLLQESWMQMEAASSSVAPPPQNADNATGMPNATLNNGSMMTSQTLAEPRRVVKITCSTTVGDREYTNSVLIRIGNGGYGLKSCPTLWAISCFMLAAWILA